MNGTMNNRLTVQNVAEKMNCSEQFIRKGLQNGIFPWGYAIRISGNRFTYWISKNKFIEFTGIEV